MSLVLFLQMSKVLKPFIEFILFKMLKYVCILTKRKLNFSE